MYHVLGWCLVFVGWNLSLDWGMRLLGWFGFAFIGRDRLDLDFHAVLLVTELGLISFKSNLHKP